VPIGIEVRDGWFQRISLTNPAGKAVAGVLNRERTEFAVTEPLGYDAAYTWMGAVVGRDGQATPVSATFTTVKPNRFVSGWFQLTDGQTVGVAAPIILQFGAPIADKGGVDGDIWDWTVDWPEWTSMSALSKATSKVPLSAPATPTDAPTLSGTPTTTAPQTPAAVSPGG
jgi:hypothetical protein